MFDLYDEFRRLIQALDSHQIEYALCGGIAMAIYAHPRATIDIDLLIASESFDEVMMIAADLGYTIPGLEMTFANGEVEIRRVSKIHQGTGQVLSLDLLLVTSAVRTIWDTRVNAEWEGGNLTVVSREGLIALKRKRGSAQDLADIQALQEDVDGAEN